MSVMQEAPVARWRIIGFYVLFAALPVATAAVAIGVAADAPRWSLAAALCAATVGALVAITLGRLPADMMLPPWAFTVGIAGACFLVSALDVSDTVAAVALGFAAGLLGVICVSLILRRKNNPESFRRQAS
jgi:hypothetical protein